MPSPAQLTNQALTFRLVENEKLRAHPRSFFMSKPTMKQVEKDGLLLWELCVGGTVRYFREDWKARYHFESALRYYRTKVLGKGS
jgi:hypothetical protein